MKKLIGLALALLVLPSGLARGQVETGPVMQLLESGGIEAVLRSPEAATHLETLLDASDLRDLRLKPPADPGKAVDPVIRAKAREALTAIRSEGGLSALRQVESSLKSKATKGHRIRQFELDSVWKVLMDSAEVRKYLLKQSAQLEGIAQVEPSSPSWWAARKLQRFGRLGTLGGAAFEKAVKAAESLPDAALGEERFAELMEFVNSCIRAGLHKKTANGPRLAESVAKIYSRVERRIVKEPGGNSYGLGIQLAVYQEVSTESRREYLDKMESTARSLAGTEGGSAYFRLELVSLANLSIGDRFFDPVTPEEMQVVERIIDMAVKSPDPDVRIEIASTLTIGLTEREYSQFGLNLSKGLIDTVAAALVDPAYVGTVADSKFAEEVRQFLVDESARLASGGGPLSPSVCRRMAQSFEQG